MGHNHPIVKKPQKGIAQFMKTQIPRPIISLLSDKLPEFETHATLDSIFLFADTPELANQDELSKPSKVQALLLYTNKVSEEPLSVLGKVIEKYMELPDEDSISSYERHAIDLLKRQQEFAKSITALLEKYGLSYIQGGLITKGGSLPSKSLRALIHEKNIPAIDLEFERALKNVNTQPLEAVSAASNLLESICRVHIEDANLGMPPKQDLRSLWKVVSTDLGFDASKIQDNDLKRVVSGMFSIVDGISALRTHGSSAHGQGTTMYKPAPRHARFAVNSAHSLAMFLLETTNNNKI